MSQPTLVSFKYSGRFHTQKHKANTQHMPTLHGHRQTSKSYSKGFYFHMAWCCSMCLLKPSCILSTLMANAHQDNTEPKVPNTPRVCCDGRAASCFVKIPWP
eukprot:scaffold106999_cov21-Tisochrysis_lutea.AAC.1